MERVALSNCEQMVMKCVWDSEGEIGVKALMESVNGRYQKEWKLQTVSTFLARLVRKGYIDMYRAGRTFLYHPCVGEEEYKGGLMRDYIDFWNNGDVADFMRCFCRELELSESCRQEIKDIVDEL